MAAEATSLESRLQAVGRPHARMTRENRKTVVRGMMVRGIKAKHVLFLIPLTIIPLTNLLQNE